MAILFIDGFDFYTTATIASRWSVSGSPTFVSGAGRFGGQGLRVGATNVGIFRDIGSNLQSGILGFAFRWNDSVRPNTVELCSLWDTTTMQLGVRIATNNDLIIHRNGNVLQTIVGGYPNDVSWHYFEIKWKIINSTASGDIEIKIDGITVLTGSAALDTQETANAYATRYRLFAGGTGTAQTLDIDDFYFKNDVTFIGERRVHTIFPDGNGNHSDFSGSDGNSVNNFQLVDENPPNGDTDYVESSTATQRDTYSFANLPTGVIDIRAVQINAYSRKTDAGTREIALTTRLGGTNYDGATKPLSSSYENISELAEVRPSDLAAWTLSDVNGAEFGFKVVT